MINYTATLETNSNVVTFLIPSVGRISLIRTINSLLKQENKFWNCSIGFDGLNQTPFDLPHDSRINTIFYPEKTGVFNTNEFGHSSAGSVRNKILDQLLESTTSEWIGFLDDDDSITEDYVQYLSTIEKDIDICIFTMTYDSTNTNLIPKPGSKKVEHCNVGISFAVKTDFLKKTQIRFLQSTGEDFVFLKQAEEMQANILFTNKIAYKVRH